MTRYRSTQIGPIQIGRFFRYLFYLPLTTTVLLLLLGSCSQIQPPSIKNFKILNLEIIDQNSFKASLELELVNPNPSPLSITLKNLTVYQLKQDLIQQITEKKLDNPELLNLSNQNVISSLASKQHFLLIESTNNFIQVGLILQNQSFFSSVFNFLLNQDIVLFLRGDLLFHHWSGEYLIPINRPLTLNLKQLFK